MDSYTSVEKAVERILASVLPIDETQKVKTKSAMGRVAARDTLAPSASPRFAISHMDGFAVVASDLAGAKPTRPARLKVLAEKHRGAPPQELTKGNTAWVSTGARLPKGADAVVPVEEVRQSKGVIRLASEVRAGSFIYPAGADFRKGDLLLRKNGTIRAQDVGLLLTLGLDAVEVFRRPTVAVLATGNELSNRKLPPPDKVRNTHAQIFVNMIRAAGCVPLDMGIGRDDPDELSATISKALSRADMVLTLGGTSAGRHDLVDEVVRGLKPSVMFHGLRMDRGRVAGVAFLNHKPLLMLPGPIQGAMNAFNLLGAPIMDRLRGGAGRTVKVRARLGADWQARPRFRDFVKVVYVRLPGAGEPKAEPLAGETESLVVLTKADGYVVVPESVTRLREGDWIEVSLMPGFSFAA